MYLLLKKSRYWKVFIVIQWIIISLLFDILSKMKWLYYTEITVLYCMPCWKAPIIFFSTIRYFSDWIICQTTISRRWPILPWEDRALTRSTLYTLSLERDVASFVRNKVVKLVVDIARHDWPHFYPDFYSNILQVCEYLHW